MCAEGNKEPLRAQGGSLANLCRCTWQVFICWRKLHLQHRSKQLMKHTTGTVGSETKGDTVLHAGACPLVAQQHFGKPWDGSKRKHAYALWAQFMRARSQAVALVRLVDRLGCRRLIPQRVMRSVATVAFGCSQGFDVCASPHVTRGRSCFEHIERFVRLLVSSGRSLVSASLY